jgi:probable rRNA maturation factor
VSEQKVLIMYKDNNQLLEDDPSLTITIADKKSLFSLQKPKIIAMATRLCRALRLSSAELGISFVSAREIRELNLTYRQIDSSTDVLSFPQIHWCAPLRMDGPAPRSLMEREGFILEENSVVLGDVVISLENAEENALAIGQPLDRELAFLLIHGLLHLCGHDHQNPEEEAMMIAMQEVLLATLSAEGEEPLWRGCVQRKRQVQHAP